MTSIATWPAKYVLPVELVIVLVFAAWPSPASANDMCDTACFDDCGDGFGVCNEGSAEICEDAGEYLDEELDGNEDAGERYGNRVPGGFELCFRIMETCGKDFYYCNEQCDPLPADCFEDEEKEDDEKEGDEKEGDEKDGEKQGEEESAEGVKDSKGSGGGSGGGSGSASGGGSGSGSGGASGGGSGGASGGGSGSGSGSDAGGESGPGSGDGAGDDGSGGDWSDGPPPIPGWPPAGGGGNNSSNNNINICVGDGACSSGDPHLKSQDGIRFDFQGAGEYHFVLSDEHDIDVQVRYEPAGASEYVSLTTALAARVGPNRITVEIGRTPPLEINGDPVTIRSGLGGALAHESGIIIDRFDTIYRINMSRGVVIKVGVYSNAMNTEVISREHPVAGLGGSNDGNRDNEFTTRDGVTLSPGYGGLTYEQLYRQFGDSWRIEQEDSLFDYEGETSTATYTNLDFPKDKLDIDTMDAAARRRAEEICREAGVRPGPDFENCVYDVGFTDDPVYAAGYARRTISTIATLDAPAEVVAGSTVAVQWTGPANENDMIALAGAEDPGNRWRASAPLDET
ncbi:MAG: VWD domain-containing protein, partial [Gammaproteobacteria bacterium]|nr:VWD domain-containing protein [Gammaproteobacteria bacterium]